MFFGACIPGRGNLCLLLMPWNLVCFTVILQNHLFLHIRLEEPLYPCRCCVEP